MYPRIRPCLRETAFLSRAATVRRLLMVSKRTCGAPSRGAAAATRRRRTSFAVLVLAALTLSIPRTSMCQNVPDSSRPTARVAAPLTEAVWTGDRDRLRRLLAAGENPALVDDQGYTPWMWAIISRDAEALSLLLERLPTIHPKEHHMLLIVAGQNDIAGIRQLLKRGVPVDTPSNDGSGCSALLVAAASGYIDLMQTLLDAGANPRLHDKHGDTPLMAAVRVGSLSAIKLLLARGADPNQVDETGRSALTWAARSRREDVVRALRAGGARGEANVVRQRSLSPRAAAEKSLPLLQHSAATWLEKTGCFSCHHQPMAIRVAAVARERGFTLDEAKLQAQFESTRGSPVEARIREIVASPQATIRRALNNVASPSFSISTALSSLLDFGVRRDKDREIQALHLARLQVADGRWRYGGPRLPIESTDFTTTANAARSLDAYGSPDDSAEMSERIRRARFWLLANTAVTTDEKVYRLLGLHWTRAGRPVIERQAKVLIGEQNADGGWAQLPGMNSDAYATGLVLVALHQAGELPSTDMVYKRAVNYLLSTQEPDGSWLVSKRAVPALKWFDTGFPHGKFQIISYVGTSWATMALMYVSPSLSQ